MMTGKPHRVQLSRRKGWQMPENTVKVARPGIWGNPFVVSDKMKAGALVGGSSRYIAVPTVEDAVACYSDMMGADAEPGQRAHELRQRLSELRGRNLACWCRLDRPCHADVLLDLANRPMGGAGGIRTDD